MNAGENVNKESLCSVSHSTKTR